MFVVKQGNSDPNWMAYLFNNISDGFGYFNIDEELRGENDYSHLRLYTRETAVSVPEIDASFAFIALAFLAGFIAIRREHG